MREVAWRIFAGEYNDSTYEVNEGGERSPTYLVTPLGAKVNRLFLVGAITEIENSGTEQEPAYRARLSDPTGTYFLFAGHYQPEAVQALSRLTPPLFAAVMGRARTYRPSEGTLYVSVRPEMIKPVDKKVRDYWVLEGARSLKKRLEAMREAQQMEPLNIAQLLALGYSENLAKGIVLATEHYGKLSLEKYERMLRDAAKDLLPEFQGFPPDEVEAEPPTVSEKPSEGDIDESEEKILTLIGSLDTTGKGASWDAVVQDSGKAGIPKGKLEEIVNSLLDKGVVYEPVLGKLRRI